MFVVVVIEVAVFDRRGTSTRGRTTWARMSRMSRTSARKMVKETSKARAMAGVVGNWSLERDSVLCAAD